MKSSEAFAKFVNILSNNENTFECAETALEVLWDDYQIARMEMKFQVPPNVFTPEGVDVNGEFAISGRVADEQNVYKKEYTTGEGGVVHVRLHRGYGYAAWTEEEQQDLDTILNVFFFHCGRFRLINQVANSMLTDVMTGLPNTQGFLRGVEEIYKLNNLTHYNSYCFNLKRF